MMLVYAVTPPNVDDVPTTGIAGGELEAVQTQDAALIVEECEHPPSTTQDSVLRFTRVVTHISTHAPTLPVRFPTVLPSKPDVLAELRSRGAQWRRRLDDVAGCSEMVLRASWADRQGTPEPADDLSGGAYLRSRAADVHAFDAMAARLEGLARRSSRDVRRLRVARGARYACLVPDDAIPALRRGVELWRREEPGRDAILSGPWPPFSFVDASEGVGA
jgi:hypothetical protein